MKEFIASFIDQKELSENSQSAYFYDLDQFIESIHGKSDTDKFENFTKLRLKILNRRFKTKIICPSTNFYIICIKNALFLNTIVWYCLKFNRPRPMIGNCWI